LRPLFNFPVSCPGEFSAINPIANPENELVAPPNRFADGFDRMGQSRDKCACAFCVHASEFYTPGNGPSTDTAALEALKTVANLKIGLCVDFAVNG